MPEKQMSDCEFDRASCRNEADATGRIERSVTALLSEPSLADDWNRPDEDAAWAHLQEG